MPEFHETVRGAKFYDRDVPNIEKSLKSISESLSVLAAEKVAPKSDKTIGLQEAMDAVCLDCFCGASEVCDTCPVSYMTQLVNANAMLASQSCGDVSVKVFVKDRIGNIKFCFVVDGVDHGEYDTAKAAADAAKAYVNGSVFFK